MPPTTPDPDLVRSVVASTGLPAPVAARVVADVLDFFTESAADYVRRRHRELQRRGLTNDAIFARIAEELPGVRVPAGELSARQLRRLVYG